MIPSYAPSPLRCPLLHRKEPCHFIFPYKKHRPERAVLFCSILEGISGGKGVGPAVTDVMMVVGNILIIVFPVEEVIHSKLESEVLIELVIGGKVHEEIGIPSLEAAAFLPCFRPVGNEHAVQVHRPGILAVRSTKVEQMAGNIIILFTLHLSCLPGVVDIGSPGVTVVLIQGNFKSMGLGVAGVFIEISRCILFIQLDIIICFA